MTTPQFVLDLREKDGHMPLWMPGCTAVVVRCAHPDAHGHRPEVALPCAPEDVEVLVVRRADNGQWTPVTGIVDPGEEPAAAAVRETLEEADVVARATRLVSVEVVGPVTYDNGDVTTYVDTAFLLQWAQGEPFPADGENTEAHFVRADRLPAMNERFTRTLARALSGEVGAAFRP